MASLGQKLDAAAAKRELWKQYLNSGRNVSVRNELADIYLPLVLAVARKTSHSVPADSMEEADLISLGAIGLIQAIENFLPEKEVLFATYAPSRIRGAILDGLRKIDWLPRLERQRVRAGETEAVRVSRFSSFTINLGTETWATDEGVVSSLTKQDQRPPWESLDQELWWKSLLRGLAELEQAAIQLYFRSSLTMKEIGNRYGVSESRISQLISIVLKKLQQREPQAVRESSGKQCPYTVLDKFRRPQVQVVYGCITYKQPCLKCGAKIKANHSHVETPTGFYHAVCWRETVQVEKETTR